jgi:hypothetical protein
MERVTDLQSLATRLGPVMYAPDRLAALERAGTVVDPAIPEEVRTALATDVVGLEIGERWRSQPVRPCRSR